MADPNDELEASASVKEGVKIRARGYDTISILLAVGIGVFGSILYVHMDDSRKNGEATIRVLKELTDSVNANVKATKFAGCLIATPDNQREAQYVNPGSYCGRQSQ